MKIFSFLVFVASLISATHIHAADIDHKDSWLAGILKYATSKYRQIGQVLLFFKIIGQKNMIILAMKTVVMKALITEQIMMTNLTMI